MLTSGPITATTGTLTGLLQNNTGPVSFLFARSSDSPINLAIVPEPSAIGMLAGGAVLGLHRRRRA